MTAWVSLKNHSQYSILDAVSDVGDLVAKAKAFQMGALALTDHGNLFGVVDFYKACHAEGLKPIIGCEFYIASESRLEKDIRGKRAFHLTLLAKNNQGYHNLLKLSSLGYLEGFYYYPRIDKELLEAYKEGLICLSGSLDTSIGHKAQEESEADFYQEIQ